MPARTSARRRLLTLPALLALAPAAVWGQAPPASTEVPGEVRAELGEASLQGGGRMRFLGLTIYDIRLWSPRPVTEDATARQPLALEITYARSLVGRQIAERSLSEMRRGGEVDEPRAARWLADMTALFPDVRAGDRITGVQQPGQAARFFLNGRFLGEVRDANFASLFFGIWLGRQTSEPELRQQLLNAKH